MLPPSNCSLLPEPGERGRRRAEPERGGCSPRSVCPLKPCPSSSPPAPLVPPTLGVILLAVSCSHGNTHKHVPVGSRVRGWRAKAATNEGGWGGGQGPRLSGGCPCARQAGGAEPGAGAATSCRVRQVQGRSGSFSPGGTIWAISRISSFISPSARPRGGTSGRAAPLCPPTPQGTGIRHYPGITALSRETLTLYNRGSISPLLALPPPRSQAGAAARQREVAGVAAGGAARRLRPRLGKGPDAVNLPAGGSGEGLRGPPPVAEEQAGSSCGARGRRLVPFRREEARPSRVRTLHRGHCPAGRVGQRPRLRGASRPPLRAPPPPPAALPGAPGKTKAGF